MARREARRGRAAPPRGRAPGAAARPASAATPQSRRSRIVSWVSGLAVLAVLATIAVVAAGYDARETPREEPSVWAMRSSGQYARVNTLTAEIDTVRTVEDPSGLVQAGALGAVLTHGNGRAWGIDAARPADLIEDRDGAADAADADSAEAGGVRTVAAESEDAGAMRLPDGTRDVVVAGGSVLLRSESGDAYLSRLDASAPEGTSSAGSGPARLAQPRLLDPFAQERAEDDGGDAGSAPEASRRFSVTAAAIDDAGTVALFSAADHEVRWYSVERGEFTGVDRVPEEIADERAQLAVVAGEWVIFEPEAGLLWREGAGSPTEIPAEGDTRLQASAGPAAGDTVLLADTAGLWEVRGGEPARIAEASGVPAQPVAVGAERYAAWVGQSGARLWSEEGERDLELDDSVELPGDPDPVIRSNGSSALLSEVQTGMLWTVPDGRLIPVEQWSISDPPKEREGSVVVADVTEQEPPVAVDDEFGVRAGEPALLPVLLNDYDPNRKDVLTIVPEGLGEGLPPEFGRVSMLPDGQTLVVDPEPTASGSARFSYRITDGIAVSEPASVQLTVADPSQNSAPQWCPVQGCQREWPSPELAPGGTLVLPVLEGWVDPEGDPMMLADAVPANPDDPVRALVTADGRLALRHADPNAPDGEVTIRLSVSDSRGATTERELVVQIRSNAQAVLAPMASAVQLGQPAVVRPLARIVGGSGSYALVDASVQSGKAEAVANPSAGTVELRAGETGESIVSVTARDSGTGAEIDGVIRVTARETRTELALPPMRAFVRPLADTTVDVLAAVPGASGRDLVVRGAEVLDGELRADVVEHAQVRVSGATGDGEPGRIGAVEVRIADGGTVASGRLTVFQVPEESGAGAIAVADSATVRAGSVADIPVLDNDVSPPGQRLVLHPEIGGSGAKGELAFASGNTLRYLAPSEPGSYTLSYTTYGASSPEASDVGQVHVTVLPRDGNRDPQPRPLTVRLAPGERAIVPVPLSGVDPDGDRVRLTGVGAPDDAQLAATIAPRSAAIQVEASAEAEPGTRRVEYTVRDEFGGEGTGRLRIIVTEDGGGAGAPVTYSDYVRLAQGGDGTAVVRPLDNDLDPAGGKLELLEVVPNVAGGADSAEYRRLAGLIELSQLEQGRVVVRGGELGTVSYRYTVRSSESRSTADGLIVVQVSARVGQQAPTVRDTVLSARDRAELERGGIDVVTDRVSWSAGDVGSLQLSVWGRAAQRFSAKDGRITGPYRAEGDLVPFRLAGKDLTGAEVESFGFLVIPPLDELRLTLKPGLAPLRVEEGKNIEAALADIVDLGPGDSAELQTGGSFPTQRAQASCEASGSGTLRYAAGKEAPWNDSCLISVKLTEQRAWTRLAVPIEIVPNEPVAELQPLTRTIAPGASETIELLDMVRWQGGREGRAGALSFQLSGGGRSFELAAEGSRLTAQARADAVPGAQEALTVTVSGAGESRSTLTLRVGTAARDAPRGATVQLSCTVGSDCSTRVIGAPGEYDPFAGKPGGGLTLTSVSGGSCAYGTIQAAGDAVRVSWPNGSRGSGGRCTATTTVTDAQGRTGRGTVELDAQGVPRAPAGVTPVSAGADSVTLSVALSGEASHPEVSGVELLAGGTPVGSCELAGGQASCRVSGLTPGERRSYTARAVNAVGASEASANGAVTWAYRPPASPSIRAESVPWPENTNPGVGRLRVQIGDSSAPTRVLTVDGAETPIPSGGLLELPSGDHRLSVVAADSPDMIPPGYTGSDGGRGEANTAEARAIGAPRPPESGTAGLSNEGPVGWRFDTSGFSSNGGDTLKFSYGLERGQTPPSCTGSQQSASVGLLPFRYYTGSVCASNSYGQTAAVPTPSIFTGGAVPAPAPANYTIDPAPSTATTDSSVAYGAVGPDESAMVTVDGGSIVWDVPVSAVSPESPNARARQCVDGGSRCSTQSTTVGPPSGLTPFTVTWKGDCIDPASDPATWGASFTITGSPGAAPSFASSGASDVVMSWPGGPYQPVTFTGTLCSPAPPSGG